MLKVTQTFVCWLGCLTSQQHASVSQRRMCSENFTCCHTEIEVADPTFHLTQSQYTDSGLTSPNTDPFTPGGWQFLSHWYDSIPEKSRRKRDSNPGSSALKADALTTSPARRSQHKRPCQQFLQALIMTTAFLSILLRLRLPFLHSQDQRKPHETVCLPSLKVCVKKNS